MPAPAPKPMAIPPMGAAQHIFSQAAMFLGCRRASSGSTIATVEWTLGPLTSTLALALVSEIAAQEETSAPVPEVVATEIWGTVQGFIFFSVSAKGGSRKTVNLVTSCPPLASITRTHLPLSMELPPPTATTPAHWAPWDHFEHGM